MKRADAWLERRYSPHLLIFATFACLYIFTAGGHLYSPDESAMFFVTQNLVERGSIAIPRDEHAISAGQTPFWYSKYGLIPSLLAVPPYWISKLLGIEAEPPSPAFPIPNGAPPLIGLLVNPLTTAGICTLLYTLTRQLGFQPSTSLAIAAIYGMGTSAWVYSKTFFSQPPATLFLLAAWCLLLRSSQPRPRDYVLAGVSLGLAVGCRAEWAILASPLAAISIGHLKRNAPNGLRLTTAFIAGFLISSGLVLGWYNYAKTGSVLQTGHGSQGTLAGFSTEPYVGVFGSLFSSGFGLFVYNPVALLGICCLPMLALRRRREAYLIRSQGSSEDSPVPVSVSERAN